MLGTPLPRLSWHKGVLRPLTEKDLLRYVAELRKHFDSEEVETDETIEKLFLRWNVHVLEKDGEFLGGVHWIPLHRKSGKPFVGMDHVWISPSLRGKGQAKKMVQEVLEIIASEHPEVDCIFDTIKRGEGSDDRRAFWSKLGVLELGAPLILPVKGVFLKNHDPAILPLEEMPESWSREHYLDTVAAYIGSFFEGDEAVEALDRIEKECPEEVLLTKILLDAAC